jgi:hypothetical protein
MDHTIVLSYDYAKRNWRRQQTNMHLRCRPFQWPCGGVETKHVALPNTACPGLQRKPLDAAIRQLLAPYRPGCRQGDSKQNKDAICTHFDGHFDGHHDVAVLYCAHRSMEEVCCFHKIN